MKTIGWLFACCCLVAPSFADDGSVKSMVVGEISAEQTFFNYQMYCQGCHTPDGVGSKAVPRLQGFVGNFLKTQQGREYLIRVPGAATSTLSSAELSAVLNWILIEFGGESTDARFERYTASEVAALRRNPLFEVDRYRTQLLADIFPANPRD